MRGYSVVARPAIEQCLYDFTALLVASTERSECVQSDFEVLIISLHKEEL